MMRALTLPRFVGSNSNGPRERNKGRIYDFRDKESMIGRMLSMVEYVNEIELEYVVI
jgi:hypothetical protein